MKLTANAKNIKNENGRLVIEYPRALEGDVLKLIQYVSGGRRLNIEFKREKRSLEANDYTWVLCQKLAEKLSDDGVLYTKEQVYRHAIKSVMSPTYLPIADKAVEGFIKVWRGNGIGWIAEVVDKSKLAGYTKIAVYQGSSTYDSKEMSRLISFLVEECKEQGIETRAPQDITSLLREWSVKNG